jgi:hypothetical protein
MAALMIQVPRGNEPDRFTWRPPNDTFFHGLERHSSVPHDSEPRIDDMPADRGGFVMGWSVEAYSLMSDPGAEKVGSPVRES